MKALSMHPTAISDSPFSHLLHMVIRSKILPKLAVESHPIFHPKSTPNTTPNLYLGSAQFGTPRKARWSDIENLHPDLPLIWLGATKYSREKREYDCRPEFRIFGMVENPRKYLYALNYKIDGDFKKLRLLKLDSATTKDCMVNPHLYVPHALSYHHQQSHTKIMTPYDPTLDSAQVLEGVPLSVIHDDIYDVLVNDPTYPPAAFWEELGTYPREGVEQVLMYFVNNPSFSTPLRHFLLSDANVNFKSLL